MVALIRSSQQASSPSHLLKYEEPRVWLPEGRKGISSPQHSSPRHSSPWLSAPRHSSPWHNSPQPSTLRQNQTSRRLHFHEALSWHILSLMTQMFSYSGNKLDCTCSAKRIFLTVKSDHVFLAHCNTKPEEFSWHGRFGIIKKSHLHWESCLPLLWTDSPNKGII